MINYFSSPFLVSVNKYFLYTFSAFISFSDNLHVIFYNMTENQLDLQFNCNIEIIRGESIKYVFLYTFSIFRVFNFSNFIHNSIPFDQISTLYLNDNWPISNILFKIEFNVYLFFYIFIVQYSCSYPPQQFEQFHQVLARLQLTHT